MKYIKTHEQLLKLHGRKITCVLNSYIIKDAKISIEYFSEDNLNGYPSRSKYPRVYVCQNERCGERCSNLFGYYYSWIISSENDHYENDNQDCKKILLQECQLEFNF